MSRISSEQASKRADGSGKLALIVVIVACCGLPSGSALLCVGVRGDAVVWHGFLDTYLERSKGGAVRTKVRWVDGSTASMWV